MKTTSLVLLVFVALLGLLPCAARSEFATPASPAALPTPGSPLEELVAAQGLPDRVVYGLADMEWYYGGEDGLRVRIHDDVVVGVWGSPPAGRARIDASVPGPALGKPAAEVARLLGSPETVTDGQFGAQLAHASGWRVVYRFGRVVSCRRD